MGPAPPSGAIAENRDAKPDTDERFVSSQPDAIKLGIGDTSSLGFDFFELMTKMMTNPAAVASAQIDLFYGTLNVWQKTAERMFMLRAQEANAPKDRRFKHPEWSENALFGFVKDSYLVAAKSILTAVREVQGIDDATARKVDFYTRQFVDALSPSNFVATNPEVLAATLDSGGQNLLRGLENLLADLERGDGRLSIPMTDMKVFRLGEHIATTPGKIIYQNDLMQLIQYGPSTQEVRKRPLLLCRRGSTSFMFSIYSRGIPSSNGLLIKAIRSSSSPG
jgi:polyhydroxyalkanoate synthase subunit PhaC